MLLATQGQDNSGRNLHSVVHNLNLTLLSTMVATGLTLYCMYVCYSSRDTDDLCSRIW